MRRYTRDEAMRESGARPEELVAIEGRGLLVPNRTHRLFGAFGETEEYYTQEQVDILRWLLKTRRAVEASHR